MDYRNLPGPVLERLAAHEVDLADLGLSCVQRGNVLEARRPSSVELRAADGVVGLSGYATVYDYPYPVAGGPELYGWTETIAAGACTKSVLERDDVRCLLNHEGIPLARTRSGTLTLTSDEVGLLVEVPELDLEGSPFAASVASALRRSDLDEMSFAFRVIRQEWSGDYTERLITEVMLFDVSVVTYPANPATVVGLRSDRPAEPVPASAVSLAYARAVADVRRHSN